VKKSTKAEVTAVVGERDGWSCHYCGVLLVPRGREAEFCHRQPRTASYERCGCGKHQYGELCEDPGGWTPARGYDWPTLDHRTPQCRGGPDDLWNLVLACLSCNSKKGTMSYFEFVNSRHLPRPARQNNWALGKHELRWGGAA
jgi:5-methylcytosine-specific restriction endonuclease McrA